MKLWHKKSLVFVSAGLVYLAGQYFRGAWFENFIINTCRESIDAFGTFCNSSYSANLGWPLITLGKMLAVVWLILLLADERTFKKWARFSLWYIPAALVLSYLIYPIRFFPGAPVLPVTYGVYPFGYLYIAATLGIVLWGRWRARKAA